MIDPAPRRMAAVCWVLLAIFASVAHPQSLLPAEARILDPDLVLSYNPGPLISPDGQWVVYVSRGFVCAANVSDGTMHRLSEIPRTWDKSLNPEEIQTRNERAKSLATLPRDQVTYVLEKSMTRLFAMQWTRESDAVAFALRSEPDPGQTSRFDVVLTDLKGNSKTLAHAEHETDHSVFLNVFALSSDRNYVVATDRWPRPLIWSVATNKPVATPFLALLPSTTSDRWIGFEKDSRQLVIVDKDFSVIQRFDEFFPSSHSPPKLHWSPDERFVIWRNQIGFDHYSNWEGCRLDLKTRERRILTGDYIGEQIRFTGRGGEFIRVRAEGIQGNFSGLITSGAFVEIIPHGSWFPSRLYSYRVDLQKLETNRLAGQLPFFAAPDFELFVIGIPRPSGPIGSVFHLTNRERKLWRLPGKDSEQYNSPYHVIGFAVSGRTIVAHDDDQLFAIPVDAIMTTGNQAR